MLSHHSRDTVLLKSPTTMTLAESEVHFVRKAHSSVMRKRISFYSLKIKGFLLWVPAHVDIAGNKIADRLANLE